MERLRTFFSTLALWGIGARKRNAKIKGELTSRATLFQFRPVWNTRWRSQPLAIKAPKSWADRYIPEAEFRAIFGGRIVWREPIKQTDVMPGEAVGVWGRRKVAKFKRILRERGAEFEVVCGEGPAQSLKFR